MPEEETTLLSNKIPSCSLRIVWVYGIQLCYAIETSSTPAVDIFECELLIIFGAHCHHQQRKIQRETKYKKKFVLSNVEYIVCRPQNVIFTVCCAYKSRTIKF